MRVIFSGFDLPFRQHVFYNALFSAVAACGKFIAIVVIMFAALSFTDFFLGPANDD